MNMREKGCLRKRKIKYLSNFTYKNCKGLYLENEKL